MTKKFLSITVVLLMLAATAVKAQVIIGGGGYYRPYYRPYPWRPRRPYVEQQQPPRRKIPPFQPSVNINVAYGFPNLDKNQLAEFDNYYKGTVTNQTGPFIGSIDYQFSRFTSIGVLGTYGKVEVPYYNYSEQSSNPDFTGRYESWSLMFNLVNYIPTYDDHVTPYLRTAIGINNTISQSYQDATGTNYDYTDNTSQLAYQVSLGLRIKLSPGAGLFLEGGYGKYIGAAGLTFKF